MSFIRRFSSMPSAQTISQIEGIVIVDALPPTPIAGVSTGVVGAVGEFADMTHAVSVDGTGNVATKPQPYEIETAQDMANNFGGWDASIGDFGGDDGNGFAMLDGKRFSRLVICPVNLASPKGVRVWRELPTNTASGQPLSPVQPATAFAGDEFKLGNDRVKLAKTVNFAADLAFASGIDGAQGDNSGPAPEGTFQSASATFIASGVKVGDALVLGVEGSGIGAPGTYRITAVLGETQIKVEKLDGADFTWTAAASPLPWRIHPGRTIDSTPGYLHGQPAGYMLPARPLDASIAAYATLDPTVTAAGVLTGLQMGIHPDGLAYDADIQAENAVTTSELEALYSECFDALLTDAYPARDVSVLIAARTSTAIRSAMKTHVLTASSQGRGRVAVIAPAVDVVSKDVAVGNTADGVGYNRDERVIYCWPGVQAVNAAAKNRQSLVKKADGTYTSEGLLDVRSDAYMASILSNLASERNPGQASDPVPLCLDSAKSFQSGLPGAGFSMTDYINFRQYGVAAIRFERGATKTFQSGITTSLDAQRKNINRRRMADEIQDSLAQIYEKYNKLPLTLPLKTTIDSETTAYLASLLSATDPSAQRIEAYSVDSKSGNTPELNAAGIYVVVVKVRMLGMSDAIVLQAEVGPTVTVTAA